MNRDFHLAEAEAMTPLVRLILHDVTAVYTRVDKQKSRLDAIDDLRRSRRYDVRKQYYAQRKEYEAVEREYHDFADELNDLGVKLVDPVRGVAGFPFLWCASENSTRYRKAIFLLKLSDNPRRRIHSWRFRGEQKERRIPSHWFEEVPAVAPDDVVEATPE